MRHVSVHCPACEKALLLIEPGASAAECPACRGHFPLDGWGAIEDRSFVERCVLCRREHFYRQRDFNRNLGLALIAGAGLVSLVLYYWSWYWSMGFLAAVTLADLALYRTLPEVTVCYVCGAVYRGFDVNPRHYGFDLHQYEVYTGKWTPKAP